MTGRSAVLSTVSLAEIETARERMAPHIRNTPMLLKEALTAQFDTPVYLKAEHLQRTGSFKVRGALNLFSQLTPDQLSAGVVAASAGNHAQGVAVAARIAGTSARIYMPVDATLSKVQATRSYGADVILEGENVNEALESARAWSEESGAVLVHPFDDLRIIAGQATLGLEILEQVPDVGTVLIPVGGGGLAAGVVSAIRQLRPQVRLIGVQSEACPSLIAAFKAGHPEVVDAASTIADGIAIKQTGAATYPILKAGLDDVVVVDDDATAEAILWLLERSKQVVEGAGAVGLAALLSGAVIASGPTVIILSGGNVDSNQLVGVIRHGLTSVGRYVRLETHLPDRPGELSRLLILLADLRVNVLNVDHRREGVQMRVGQARIDLTLQTRDAEHLSRVLQALEAASYQARVIG